MFPPHSYFRSSTSCSPLKTMNRCLAAGRRGTSLRHSLRAEVGRGPERSGGRGGGRLSRHYVPVPDPKALNNSEQEGPVHSRRGAANSTLSKPHLSINDSGADSRAGSFSGIKLTKGKTTLKNCRNVMLKAQCFCLIFQFYQI